MQGDVVPADPLLLRHWVGDGEQAPARANGASEAGELVAGQGEVERRVHAGGVLGLGVADGLGRTQTAHQVGVDIGRGGDHPRPGRGEQRHHRGADTAGGPDDQDGFARPHLGGGHQGPRGQPGGGQCRRLFDGQTGGAVRQQRGVRLEDRVLGQGPGAQRRPRGTGHGAQHPGYGLAEDLVPHAVGGHPGTDLGDGPGEVVAGHVRECQRRDVAESATGQLDVAGVERGGGDADLDLSRSRPWHRHLGHRVLLGWAVASGHNCLHGFPSRKTDPAVMF